MNDPRPGRHDRLLCSDCGSTYRIAEPRWRCDCGGLLALEAALPFVAGRIAEGERSLWRYGAFLPVEDPARPVTMGEGWTPLVPLSTDGPGPRLKLEFTNPTGSFKDRGATLLVTRLRELGVEEVVEDSSGNAGAALAAYCARAGIVCHIYAPASHSTAKLRQILAHGAELIAVAGSRQDVAEAALRAAEHSYYASHVYHPLYLEGTKTIAFELWEQLGGRAPAVVVTPVGNGALLLGIWQGFDALWQAGAIDRRPRMIGVQAEACAPLAQAFASGASRPVTVVESATLAEGIRIAAPARGEQILAAVRASGGQCRAVTEAEIGAAARELAGRGFYVEPTAATALAGYRQLGETEASDAVLLLTGSGLKQG